MKNLTSLRSIRGHFWVKTYWTMGYKNICILIVSDYIEYIFAPVKSKWRQKTWRDLCKREHYYNRSSFRKQGERERSRRTWTNGWGRPLQGPLPLRLLLACFLLQATKGTMEAIDFPWVVSWLEAKCAKYVSYMLRKSIQNPNYTGWNTFNYSQTYFYYWLDC